MFKNLFDLKVYNVKKFENELVEIKTIEELNSLRRDSVKLMPTLNLNENTYIPGDLYVNKETKEVLVFSFYSHLYDNSLNSIGFYHIKSVNDFLKTPEELNDMNDADELPFPLVSINSINLKSFTKVANIILNVDYSRLFIGNLYKKPAINNENINDTFISLSRIIYELMDIKILIQNNKKNDCEVRFINILNEDIVLDNDFKFLPKLWIKGGNEKDIFGFHLQINTSIITPKKNKSVINKNYMTLFDIESFKSFIKLDKEEDINYEYLSKFQDNHYRELAPFDRNYQESLLSFL